MSRFWDLLPFGLMFVVGVAVGVSALLGLGFRPTPTLDPPPKGITPEDIQQMTVTEKRVLGRCQLHKLWAHLESPGNRGGAANTYFLATEQKSLQSGQSLSYIWYRDGFWCGKEERHDFWTNPPYD